MSPGSNEATEKGCTCPSEHNQQGHGATNIREPNKLFFVIDRDCPLHGAPAWQQRTAA